MSTYRIVTPDGRPEICGIVDDDDISILDSWGGNPVFADPQMALRVCNFLNALADGNPELEKAWDEIEKNQL